MPIFNPFKWLVRLLIICVVSCRSKSVLPQLGQEIYSVLEMRVRVACSIPNDKDASFANGVAGESIHIPEPNPSTNKAPISVDAYNCIFEIGSSGSITSPTGPEKSDGE